MTPAPAPSSPRLRIALEGFSDFERSAMASYFRLAGDRFPAYEQAASADDARFIVADADHPGVVRSIVDAGREADTVFIGSQAPEGALAWMMRPIDPMHVLRELDAAVALRGAAVMPARASRPSRRASDLPPPARSVSPEALIVDDNEVAVRALERQLQGLGVTAARANTSGKALELMARLAFRWIFIDVDLGPASELDGLTLCQHIKHQHHQSGGPVPSVFLMSAGGEPVNRVRGTLAGCDAYLEKPFEEAVVKRLLSAHGATLSRAVPARALRR